MHLVDFTTEIYYDARPSERQIRCHEFVNYWFGLKLFHCRSSTFRVKCRTVRGGWGTNLVSVCLQWDYDRAGTVAAYSAEQHWQCAVRTAWYWATFMQLALRWEKAIIVTYSGFVSVALGTQHTKRMRRIVKCSLFGSAAFLFPHNVTNSKIFRRKCYWRKNVLIFSTTFVWYISHSKN